MKDKHDKVTMEMDLEENVMTTISKENTKMESTNDHLKKLILMMVSEELSIDFDHESEQCYLMQVEVGEFDNCREYGYTYRVVNGEQDITFCVYEHRNSDDIIINGCRTKDVKEYGPYNGESKYDFLFGFRYNQHQDCANKLAECLRECYLGNFDEGVLL